MPPRPYNSEFRRRVQADLKSRIAAAAAELHAAKGALRTSYTDVAQRAAVSLPTVYKHFPSLDELIEACSAHVMAQAPAVDPRSFAHATDLSGAARRLVIAADRLNAHFEPWLVWQEHRHIRVLARLAADHREQLTAHCRILLGKHAPDAELGETAALWEALLSFEVWHRLVREHKMPRAAVRRRLQKMLLAAAGSQ